MSDEVNWLVAEVGRHAFQPMNDPKATIAHPPIIMKRGEGVHVIDIHGNRLLDCQAGLWCVNAGHGRPEIIAAITEQLQELAYYTSFPGSANAPSIRLSARLCELAAEEGMARAMFGSGGSDAVETAFKLARQYWKLVRAPEKTKFISLRGSYHGMHFAGMSAGGGDAWSRVYEPLVPGFINVEFPNIYRPPLEGYEPEQLAEACAHLLEREIAFQSADTIAAIIAEPIQGAGGVNVPPDNYWQLLRRICDRHDILLIADEVVTGFGRSGALFGARGWGVKPDMMCLAKGITSGYIPLGATLVNERVATAWDADDPRAVIMHGYTYSGHPVACAAGLAAVELAVSEGHAGNAGDVGAYLIERLRGLMERHEVIGDVRGKGLMIAVELVKDRATREPYGPMDRYPAALSEACMGNGVMLRTMITRFILSPPLILTRAQADEIVTALDHALTSTPR